MLGILAVAMNTYREAVRARILHGLMGLAVATCGYALVVGAYALRNQGKVVSDLGAASISLYSILVAVVLGASSLYRELELKTIFPILARPIERSHYIVGKFLGTILTLFAFVCLNSGLLLFAIGALSDRSLSLSIAVPLGIIGAFALVAYKSRRLRTWLPVPLGLVLVLLGAWFAREGTSERGVILGQGVLTLMEVCIVTAICMVFAAFSSPFLTAVFTICVFIVGRSADTLAQLPEHLFGATIKATGKALSEVFPNLMVYVPSRELLTGEAVGASYGDYALWAFVQAVAWTVGLLTVASLVFRRRDFL